MKLGPSVAAVVTGAASGLGEATARALATTGVRVALFDLNAEAGEALAATLGGVFCRVDVTSEASVEEGFARAREAHGQERIMVNCAGGGVPGKTVGRDKITGEIKPLALEGFMKVVRLNLASAFLCTSRSAAGMCTLDAVDGERGAIVNTASAAGVEGQVGQVAYAAGKAAVIGMTLPIARDLSSEGIRINTVMPGIFDTPPMRAVSDPVREMLAQSVPFPKRLGAPEEFASMVLELCRNGYMNGETIRLDGAIRMGPR